MWHFVHKIIHSWCYYIVNATRLQPSAKICNSFVISWSLNDRFPCCPCVRWVKRHSDLLQGRIKFVFITAPLIKYSVGSWVPNQAAFFIRNSSPHDCSSLGACSVSSISPAATKRMPALRRTLFVLLLTRPTPTHMPPSINRVVLRMGNTLEARTIPGGRPEWF